MNITKERDLFEGFLYKLIQEKINPFYLPPRKATKIFMKAKERFPEQLKQFSQKPINEKCIILEELINYSISLGNLKATQTPAGGNYNIWNLTNSEFTISPNLLFNRENYQENKFLIDYLFELYSK